MTIFAELLNESTTFIDKMGAIWNNGSTSLGNTIVYDSLGFFAIGFISLVFFTFFIQKNHKFLDWSSVKKEWIKIIFCSNYQSEKGFPFHLYMINVDGSGLEQITYDKLFDSFAMFSPDGKYLVFCSDRFNGGTRDTNVFLAEWVE